MVKVWIEFPRTGNSLVVKLVGNNGEVQYVTSMFVFNNNKKDFLPILMKRKVGYADLKKREAAK